MGRTFAVLVVLVLTACGATESTTFSEIGDEITACEQAFADAAAEDEMHDSVEDMFPAVKACASLEDWEAAWDQFGDELGFSGSAQSVLSNMCLSDEIASTDLCTAVNE